MKFNFFDKFMLVLILLSMIALSALCIGTSMGFISYEMITGPIAIITNGLIGNRLILGAAGVILLAVALRLFVAMGKKKAYQPAAAPAASSAVMLSGDNGTAYISIAAIDQLVQRHCRANAKIKDCESNVIAAQDPDKGVSIKLKLSVAAETVAPELSANLQQSLKQYIESLSGVNVNTVDIMIIPTQVKPL